MTSTPIAKMVREMIERGVDIDIIELAVSTAEQTLIPRNSTESAEEKRKRKDRERKRLSKEIPRNSTEIPRNEENASLSIEKESKKKEKKEREQASQLPVDWRPSPESWAEACALLGSDDRAELELKKFRNHAAEKGRTSKHWSSAWANWAIKAVEYGGRNGQGTGNNRTAGFAGSPATGDDAVVTGMARALERRRAARGANDPGRPEFRTDGGDGFTGGNAPEPTAASGDGGSHRELALIPGRDGRE